MGGGMAIMWTGFGIPETLNYKGTQWTFIRPKKNKYSYSPISKPSYLMYFAPLVHIQSKHHINELFHQIQKLMLYSVSVGPAVASGWNWALKKGLYIQLDISMDYSFVCVPSHTGNRWRLWRVLSSQWVK